VRVGKAQKGGTAPKSFRWRMTRPIAWFTARDACSEYLPRRDHSEKSAQSRDITADRCGQLTSGLTASGDAARDGHGTYHSRPLSPAPARPLPSAFRWSSRYCCCRTTCTRVPAVAPELNTVQHGASSAVAAQEPLQNLRVAERGERQARDDHLRPAESQRRRQRLPQPSGRSLQRDAPVRNAAHGRGGRRHAPRADRSVGVSGTSGSASARISAQRLGRTGRSGSADRCGPSIYIYLYISLYIYTYI
jgi:hypothetical protein